jgi:hypothetical protein
MGFNIKNSQNKTPAKLEAYFWCQLAYAFLTLNPNRYDNNKLQEIVRLFNLSPDLITGSLKPLYKLEIKVQI